VLKKPVSAVIQEMPKLTEINSWRIFGLKFLPK
jgi:hypothetical protein